MLILARFLTVWAGTPFPINLVTSDSMEPSLFEGDIVAWTPVNIEDVEVGDVIVFKSYVSWPDEKILVHRVNNITTSSSGAILLETKGDKNPYTDQAGPHIPEPYIREDNLQGRVLSIAKQPLKIPFVGFIGLWINNGLNSLSQPSASKESASYAGVFAPLAISVVILVVLLFILPERATTVKEKIHLNIFGRKPLDLKKTLVTFLAAYVIFLLVIHCFAYDSIQASVGINDASPRDGLDFGRVGSGEESIPKQLPLINPSTMPVKGIVFGKGDIGPLIPGQIFQLERGEDKTTMVSIVAPNGTTSGGYSGNIVLYSSPFWLMFPDWMMEGLIGFNAEVAVIILDLLSALVLTGMTFLILISVSFTGEKLIQWAIDRSWYHPSRMILKRQTVKKISETKRNARKSLSKNAGWVLNVDYSDLKPENIKPFIKKPIIASALVIPIIFLLRDQMLALFISVILAGVIAYMISCKFRSKIVITALIALTISIIHLMVVSNLVIISQDHTVLEIMSLSFGVMGVYLLLLGLLLVPFSIASWFIARFIRNLKEQKDPLLSLEGSCDL